jgi:hypothetical protein
LLVFLWDHGLSWQQAWGSRNCFANNKLPGAIFGAASAAPRRVAAMDGRHNQTRSVVSKNFPHPQGCLANRDTDRYQRFTTKQFRSQKKAPPFTKQGGAF